MFRMYLCFFLCVAAHVVTSSANVISANEVIEDKELVLAFVINRHGDRTPDEDELSLSAHQKEEIANLTTLYGLEALTNVGKRRAYDFGKFIRQRYGVEGLGLISNLYLQDEIVVRSTDKDRTKMTALVAMSAVYPPEAVQEWNNGLGKVWQPVPYTTIPLDKDFLRFYSNCGKFKSLLKKVKENAMENEFVVYQDLVEKIKHHTGSNFSENPLLFQTLFDLFKGQTGLGVEIPNWATPQMPRISEAARLAFTLYYSNDEMKRLAGGVLMDQFHKAALDVQSGRPVTQRLRVFSSHDFNVAGLMTVSMVDIDKIPEYGSAFTLELYKSRKNPGQLYVQATYLTQPSDSAPHNLKIADCGFNCDLNRFIELTKAYTMTQEEYNTVCGLTCTP